MFVDVKLLGASESKKTNIYGVSAKGVALGVISWHAPWRRYVFFPAAGTLYDSSCLSEISNYINGFMREKKRRDDEASVL